MREAPYLGAGPARFFVLMIVVFTILLARACSSGTKDSESAGESSDESGELAVTELVWLSERETIRAESARVSMRMTTESQNDMPPFQFSSEGVQNFKSGDSVSTMSMPMFGQRIEVRTVCSMMYQKWPEEMLTESGVPAGKTWISTDLEEQYRKQMGLDVQSLQNQVSSSTTGQLEYLRSVGSAKEVGEETLRGVGTTHYRAVVDLDRDLNAIRGNVEDEKALEEYYERLKRALGTDKLPLDVWLDDRGRVYRYVMNYSIVLPEPTADRVKITAPAGPSAEKAEVRQSMEFYDYGVPVNVEAPPEQKTISNEDALAAQGRAPAG